MKIIPISQIEIRSRQRQDIATGALNELRDSILSTKGLLHPPVVWFDSQTQTYILSAGERRLRAIQLIAKAEKTFRHGVDIIPVGSIPVTLVEELSTADLIETELEENIIRVDLSWQDRARALAALHQQRQKENPEQTKSDTVRELAGKMGKEVDTKSGRVSDSGIYRGLTQALILSDKLDDPKISKARNAAEAQALVLKAEEERLSTILAARRISTSKHEAQIEVRRGDLCEMLPRLDEGRFDLVLGDPPYGIKAGAGGFRGRTVLHHNYEDDPETAKLLYQTILTESFRVTKPRANIFLFCEIKLWHEWRTMAGRMGWEVFPSPIIWQKSEAEGLAPWGRQGFRKTYDAILYATKGGKGLITSPVDILNVKRVPRNLRLHAAEKPVDLLRLLIECSTLAGDFVLDPCCGSGSTLVAARECHRKALGIEKDEDYYNTAMANVFGKEGDDDDQLAS